MAKRPAPYRHPPSLKISPSPLAQQSLNLLPSLPTYSRGDSYPASQESSASLKAGFSLFPIDEAIFDLPRSRPETHLALV